MTGHRFSDTFLSASLLLGGLSTQGLAQSGAVALFLTIPPGSRAHAMGGAQTAVANDFYALHFNPAGLSRLEKGSAGFSRHKFVFGPFPITFMGGVYATRYGTLGLALSHLDLKETLLGETLDSYHRRFSLVMQSKSVHTSLSGVP